MGRFREVAVRCAPSDKPFLSICIADEAVAGTESGRSSPIVPSVGSLELFIFSLMMLGTASNSVCFDHI